MQPMIAREKSSKGSKMKEYTVECEECESTTDVFAYSKPEFCPCCGRRAEVESRRLDFEEPELLLEDE